MVTDLPFERMTPVEQREAFCCICGWHNRHGMSSSVYVLGCTSAKEAEEKAYQHFKRFEHGLFKKGISSIIVLPQGVARWEDCEPAFVKGYPLSETEH